MNRGRSWPLNQGQLSPSPPLNRGRSNPGLCRNRDTGLHGFFDSFRVSCKYDVNDLGAVRAQDVPGLVHGQAPEAFAVDVDDLIPQPEATVT